MVDAQRSLSTQACSGNPEVGSEEEALGLRGSEEPMPVCPYVDKVKMDCIHFVREVRIL